MLTAIMEQLTSLQEERAVHVARVQEIDGKLAGIARQLDLKPEAMEPATDLPRLAAPAADKRHVGSMPERILEILRDATEPHTRTSVKKILRDDPKFSASIMKNENTFYNNVARYVRTRKIVEKDGYLYHPDRAPLPDGADDPTGQHFAPNVSPIRRLDLGG